MSKSIFLSKTFWGSVIAVVGGVAGLDPKLMADLSNLTGLGVDATQAVVTLIGAALAIYGRYKADQPVHVAKKK